MLNDTDKSKLENLVNSLLAVFTANPSEVKYISATDCVIVEIVPHKDDRGLILGRHGRVAIAIRTLMTLVGYRLGHEIIPRFIVEKPARTNEPTGASNGGGRKTTRERRLVDIPDRDPEG